MDDANKVVGNISASDLKGIIKNPQIVKNITKINLTESIKNAKYMLVVIPGGIFPSVEDVKVYGVKKSGMEVKRPQIDDKHYWKNFIKYDEGPTREPDKP